ncbi:PKD domain-containing protein [Saccharicrinis aurantiacus]|uniref:PKD domain-containing protein n=1 Tax=Saccharicrinis aurantiacus TaxID=1849719 RepID=UPI00249129B8|nr:PKD domain-containing protein [Saccharicrinis aurantiacus]
MRLNFLTLLFLSLCLFSFSQSPNFSTDLINNTNCGPSTVTFSIDNPVEGSTYRWDFGNGEPIISGTISASDDGTASTTYLEAGIFSAQLTINESQSSVQVITIYAIPEPEFTVIDGTGCLANKKEVTFKYTGEVPEHGADISTWEWNFGDGSDDVLLTGSGDTSYEYYEYGTYNVLVEVVDGNGCKASYFEPNAVQIYSTPVADFDIYYDASCIFPLELELTDTSTDGQNSISQYQWNIDKQGEGTIAQSTNQNPKIELPSGGTYDITLAISTSPGQCNDQIFKQVSFEENVVSFLPNTTQTICQGQVISFTDTSLDGNGDEPVSYFWDFGDGTTSEEKNPDHTFLDATLSPYSVTLVVTFSNGCQSSKTIDELVIVNEATTPIIDVDIDQSCENFEATITATPGASEYKWDFDYDGITPNFTQTTTSNVVSHIYTEEKDSIVIYLEVLTADGCILHNTYSYIDVIYPHANFEVTTGINGCFSATASFDASASVNTMPEGNNAIVKYSWDFENDGVFDEETSSPITSKEYGDEGEYSVLLRIETATGCTDDTIIVAAVKRGYPPIASFTINQPSTCRISAVEFTSTSIPNNDGEAEIDSLIWNFGDGTSISGNPITNPNLLNPSHVYSDDTEDNNTPFTVSLIAFSNGCESDVATELVEITYPISRFEIVENENCLFLGEISFVAFDPDDPSRLSEGVDSYRWELGDGTYYPGPTANDWASGSDPSITHRYIEVGFFRPTLYVRNAASNCEDASNNSLQVLVGAPNFEADKTQICHSTVSDKVTFTNLSSSTSPYTIYNWDFGEGAVPREFTGSHPPAVLYTTTGLKTVSLTLSEGLGCFQDKINVDYIDVRGPVTDFIWQSDNSNNSVQCLEPTQNVTYTSTTGNTPNVNTNVLYEWNFGSGAKPASLIRNNEVPIVVNYTTSGEKTISLKVTDNEGCVNDTVMESLISVPNPIAKFSVAAQANFCINEEIEFVDESSESSNFSITNWFWEFGEDASTESFTGQNPPLISYPTKGDKTISLTITNNTGCTNTITKTIGIYQANASFTVPSENGCAPVNITFTDTSVDIVEWFWEFNDGFGSTSNKQNPSQLFLYPGVYDVSLTTTSKGGCKATENIPAALSVEGSYYDDFTVDIDPNNCLESPDNPEATFTIKGLVDVKYLTLDFGDGSAAYTHTFADGGNTDSHIITHDYERLGEYQPKLTLEDTPGPESCGPFVYIPDIDPIIISEKPIPSIETSVDDEIGCQDKKINFIDATAKSGGIVDDRFEIVEWLWEFGDVDNSTSTEQNPSFTYTQSGMYTVSMTVTTAIGCQSSTSIEIEITDPISDNTLGGDFDMCDLTPLLLDGATPTGGVVGEYVFHWQESTDGSNWNAAPGDNNLEDYQIESKGNSTQIELFYRRKVQSGNCVLFSPNFNVTIDPTTIPGQLEADRVECYNDNNNILTLSDYVGSIKEWQFSNTADFTTYTTVAETSHELVYTNLTETTYYRVLVQSGICSEAFSNVVKIEVTPEIGGNNIGEDQDICSDVQAAILTASSPTGGEGNFTYQWQSSSDNIDFLDIDGATQETYQPGLLSETTYFRRVVMSNDYCQDYSESLMIFVRLAPNVDLTVITSSTCENADGTIIIENSELGISYFILDIDNGNAEVASANGTGSDLEITIPNNLLPDAGDQFNFLIRANNEGLCERDFPPNSFVMDQLPIVDLNISDEGNICQGSDAIVTIEASQLGYTYSVLDINNSNKVVASSLSPGGDLEITIPSSEMAESGLFEYSVAVTNGACEEIMNQGGAFIIIPTPSNALEVSDPNVCIEASPPSTSIVITSSENDVKYQLRLDSDNSPVGNPIIGDGGDISISITTPLTTTVYNVLAVSEIQKGDNSYCDGVELLDKVFLTIVALPSDANEVTDPIVCAGAEANILVRDSEIDVSYTMRQNGTDIQTILGNGSDIQFSTIPTPQVDTQYEIFAQSTLNNGLCTEVKLVDVADVTIIQEPAIDASVSDADVCEGHGDVSITVTPTSTLVNYELREKGGSYTQKLAGTGNDLNFIVPEPTVSIEYEVYATPIELNSDGDSCNVLKLTDTAIIGFAPTPDNTLSVNGDVICIGSAGVISIDASELDVIYQLRENVSKTNVGTPVEGTGGAILFDPINALLTTSYEVVASSAILTCSDVILDNHPDIEVISEPNLGLGVSANPLVVCSGNSSNITVSSTELGVRYQLVGNGSPIEGQMFDGNNLDQVFAVSPLEITTYTILATPIQLDETGASCADAELSNQVTIDVEGPITIIQQPFDAYACNTETASFNVIAENQNNGTLLYQWQLGGVDLVDAEDEISGATTANLTILDLSKFRERYPLFEFARDGTQFNVNISTAECSQVVSDDAYIHVSSPPNGDNFIISADNICIGNNLIVNFTSELELNAIAGFRDYRLTYDLFGSNVASDNEVVTRLVNADGSGSFVIPASELVNEGSTGITVTKIDFASSHNCAVEGLSSSDLFDVETVPDVSDVNAIIDNICIGNAAQVEVTSTSLLNGTYNVTYALSGANSAASLISSMQFENGIGAFEISEASLINAGVTVVDITNISGLIGEECEAIVSALQINFEVEPEPNTTGLSASANNICFGNVAEVKISGALSDGTYTFSYNLSGANNSENHLVEVNFANGDGSAQFTIPAEYLSTYGSMNIEIIEVANASGQQCKVDMLSVDADFDIEEVPNVGELSIIIDDVCEEEDVVVQLISNLKDGNYQINYQINGANNIYLLSEDINFTTGDGNADFIISGSIFAETGLNTLTITSVVDLNSSQLCASRVIAQENFTIEPTPNTDAMAIQATNTCLLSSSRVTINSSLSEGVYQFGYEIITATKRKTLSNLISIASDGTGYFIIPGYDLDEAGLHTISISEVRRTNQLSCTQLGINISADFMVEDLPNTTTLTIDVDDTCFNSDVDVDIVSSLQDGLYEITYELIGSNQSLPIVEEMSFVGGLGNFNIDSDRFANTGATIVHVFGVQSLDGEQCEGQEMISAKGELLITPLPVTEGLKVYAFDACEGNDVVVDVVSNLVDGAYEITYYTTGKNISVHQIANVDITSGDGNFEFYIPSDVVPNVGVSTIWITKIKFTTGTECSKLLEARSNFAISKVPDISGFTIATEDICHGQDQIIEVNSQLEDGVYNLTLDITGVNLLVNYSAELVINTGDGSGEILIPKEYLLNDGINNISVKEISDTKGALCSSPIVNVGSQFNIETIPIVDGLQMAIEATCLGLDGKVSLSGNLERKSYLLTYNLSGANTVTGQTVEVNIESDFGSGAFIIPAELITNAGLTYITITDVANIEGLACNVPVVLVDDFLVVSIGGSFDGVMITRDMCLGDDASVEIETSLPNGDYEIKYNLEGANQTVGLSTIIRVFNGRSDFVVTSNDIQSSGQQIIVITEITYIGVNRCNAAGFEIESSFNIEGPISIIEQPIPDNQCANEPVTFNAGAVNDGLGDLQFQWQVSSDDGTSFLDINNQEGYSGTDTETLSIANNSNFNNRMYRMLAYTTECNSVESDAVRLVVLTGSQCGEGLENLPNAFTPNGDGVNDFWFIEGAENYPSNKVQVFNRSGGLLYEVQGYNNQDVRFDGKSNKGSSKVMPDGTYFYIINLGDGSDILKGYLIINR